MSAPPGRSATVHSLSGRVNALKFMQRASPSSTPTKSTTSTLPSTPATPASPSTSVPASPSIGGEDEQWSLSPAAIARLRAKAQGQSKNVGPTIEQEAGFDAWLITREKEAQSSEERGAKTSSRQTFGKLGKQKEDDDEEDSKKRSRGADDGEGEEPDFDEDESEDEKPRGFVKPGSLSKSNKAKRSEKQEQAPSPSSSKKARKDKGKGGKDQDKVVYARKRGGKLGISGGGR